MRYLRPQEFNPELPPIRQLTREQLKALNRKGPLWEVMDDYYRWTETLGWFCIKRSLLTNGASRPPWAKWLISRFGRHTGAVLPHDGGYDGKLYDLDGNLLHPTRSEMDDAFLELMIQDRVRKWKRNIMFKAVRIRGASHWHKNSAA